MVPLQPTTDGLIELRPPQRGDAETLITGRDEAFHRWLGPGGGHPQPRACIAVDGEVVGWVDYDTEREWLQPGEVNVGYNVFAPHRGNGYATRAVQLLAHHLALRTSHQATTLVIDARNERSLALAARLGFRLTRHDGRQRHFSRPVPPLAYSDGALTIRPPKIEDLSADLEAKDEEQIRWMWQAGERESWVAMSQAQQRDHARRVLQQRQEAFGSGPKWTFSVDNRDTAYVAYVDCDLHHADVPPGEANLAYSTHPAHRRKGYASRALRLLMHFLNDHTGARYAHIVVEAENIASLRVARSVGANRLDEWTNDEERRMIRHVARIRGLPHTHASLPP